MNYIEVEMGDCYGTGERNNNDGVMVLVLLLVVCKEEGSNLLGRNGVLRW